VVKPQEREADHSSPTSVEVKKTWIYTSSPFHTSSWRRTVYPNLFSLPYPLIRLFIYEYPLSSLPPPIPQKSFLFFLISLGYQNNKPTQINLMTFIGFHFSFYIFTIYFNFFYNSILIQYQNKNSIKIII
jgi:hypothetical protein